MTANCSISNGGGTLPFLPIAWNESQSCRPAIRDVPNTASQKLDVSTYLTEVRKIDFTMRLTDDEKDTLLLIFTDNTMVTLQIYNQKQGGYWIYTGWLEQPDMTFEYKMEAGANVRQWKAKLSLKVDTIDGPDYSEDKIVDGSFEDGDGWSTTGSTNYAYEGVKSLYLFTNPVTQLVNINIPQETILTFGFWCLEPSGDSVDASYTINYTDATSTTNIISSSYPYSWTYIDIISQVTVGKSVESISFTGGTDVPIYVDVVTLTTNILSDSTANVLLGADALDPVGIYLGFVTDFERVQETNVQVYDWVNQPTTSNQINYNFYNTKLIKLKYEFRASDEDKNYIDQLLLTHARMALIDTVNNIDSSVFIVDLNESYVSDNWDRPWIITIDLVTDSINPYFGFQMGIYEVPQAIDTGIIHQRTKAPILPLTNLPALLGFGVPSGITFQEYDPVNHPVILAIEDWNNLLQNLNAMFDFDGGVVRTPSIPLPTTTVGTPNVGLTNAFSGLGTSNFSCWVVVSMSRISDATGYIIKYKRSVDTVWDIITHPQTDSEDPIVVATPSLQESTLYDFDVAAISGASTIGTLVHETNWLTASNNVAYPVPSSVIADPITNGITLSWDDLRLSGYDFLYYNIYHSTTNDVLTATLLGNTGNPWYSWNVTNQSTDFIPQYFWITTMAPSGLESAKSTVAFTTPLGINAMDLSIEMKPWSSDILIYEDPVVYGKFYWSDPTTTTDATITYADGTSKTILRNNAGTDLNVLYYSIGGGNCSGGLVYLYLSESIVDGNGKLIMQSANSTGFGSAVGVGKNLVAVINMSPRYVPEVLPTNVNKPSTINPYNSYTPTIGAGSIAAKTITSQHLRTDTAVITDTLQVGGGVTIGPNQVTIGGTLTVYDLLTGTGSATRIDGGMIYTGTISGTAVDVGSLETLLTITASQVKIDGTAYFSSLLGDDLGTTKINGGMIVTKSIATEALTISEDDGGVTRINGNNISTGTITTNQIDTNSIFVDMKIIVGPNAYLQTGSGSIRTVISDDGCGSIGMAWKYYDSSSNQQGFIQADSSYGLYIVSDTNTNKMTFRAHTYSFLDGTNFSVDAGGDMGLAGALTVGGQTIINSSGIAAANIGAKTISSSIGNGTTYFGSSYVRYNYTNKFIKLNSVDNVSFILFDTPIWVTTSVSYAIPSSYGWLTQIGTIGTSPAGTKSISIRSSGIILSSGEIDVVSDQRDKNLIDCLTPKVSLDAISKLNPLHFSWKPETNKGEYVIAGFFAQEVAKAIPEAVSIYKGEKRDDEHTLNYNVLTAYTVSAIQALIDEVKELKDRIKKLED